MHITLTFYFSCRPDAAVFEWMLSGSHALVDDEKMNHRKQEDESSYAIDESLNVRGRSI